MPAPMITVRGRVRARSRRGRLRLSAIAILVAMLSLTAASSTAGAAPPHVRKAMWGPVSYGGVSQFPIYRDLGVDLYQYPVFWSDVATARPASPRDPNDPAYAWPADLDLAVAQGAKYGIDLVIRASRTPSWANGGKGGTVPPSRTQDYSDFLVAAAKRYRSIHLWMIWEEPIRSQAWAIAPQSPSQRARQVPFTATQRRAVQAYAAMVDASYGALKRLSGRNRVIGGNTTTTGDVNPKPFVRAMRLADGLPPRMDMYGHNPFGARRPDIDANPLLPGTADFSDLDTLAGWIDKHLARAGRNRRLPLFLSEYTIPTDVASAQWPYHVTRVTQASWLRSAFRIANAWPRVYALGWYTLRDPDPKVDRVSGRNGLIDLQGRRKPAYAVYRSG